MGKEVPSIMTSVNERIRWRKRSRFMGWPIIAGSCKATYDERKQENPKGEGASPPEAMRNSSKKERSSILGCGSLPAQNNEDGNHNTRRVIDTRVQDSPCAYRIRPCEFSKGAFCAKQVNSSERESCIFKKKYLNGGAGLQKRGKSMANKSHGGQRSLAIEKPQRQNVPADQNRQMSVVV